MSTTIKTYVGIFILLLSVFTMAGVMSACIDANNARDFHASVVAEIENSNFAPSVINACKTQAANAGYELLIDESSIVKDEDGKPTPVPKLELITEDDKRRYNDAISRREFRMSSRHAK